MNENNEAFWFRLESRTSNVRSSFEADIADFKEYKSEDFNKGKVIENWKGDVWLCASSSEYEGELEDVLKTAYHLLLFSERLKAALEQLAVGGVQYLPVSIFDSQDNRLATYYIANILNVVPALDEDASVILWGKLPQRDGTVTTYISYLRKAVFKSAAVQDHDMIILPNYHSAFYVSDRIKRLFEGNRFTGVGFAPVGLA